MTKAKKTRESLFIPLCVPELRGNEWLYVKECLDTNWVSSVGGYVEKFEQMMGKHVGCDYAVATVNGTAALHIALLVAGVQPNDEVVVSDVTFIASANAVKYAGAMPTFIDADPCYWQMDTLKLADFLEKGCQFKDGTLRNKETGRHVKAIMPVHIIGHPVDMDPILTLAEKFNLIVVEDATESLGATYKGKPVGSLGHIACFSYNGNKLITTGGGGMITTNNELWAERAKYLTTQAKDDPVQFIHGELGFNYRLTNVQAALGCAQLENIDEYIEIKRKIAQRYTTAFENIPGIIPMQEASWANSVFWMYTILVDDSVTGVNSRWLLQTLQKESIQTRPLWQPMHLSPVHQDCFATQCHTAEKLYDQSLSLPCSVGLTEIDQERVISTISRLLESDPT